MSREAVRSLEADHDHTWPPLHRAALRCAGHRRLGRDAHLRNGEAEAVPRRERILRRSALPADVPVRFERAAESPFGRADVVVGQRREDVEPPRRVRTGARWPAVAPMAGSPTAGHRFDLTERRLLPA